ncbi:MAG: STAS domain-containing protein [Anaerolineales bacterium]
MQVKSEERGEVVVISVEGSLDALTAPELGQAFSTQIAGGHFNLVADLTKVDYSSSAGLRVLLTALKETRQNGGDLRLAAVQANVNKVLTLAGVSGAIEQYPDVEAAISRFNDAP